MISIYIDMDDVLTESYQTFINVLEREFGKTARYSQITSFDLQESFGLTPEEYEHFFECIHDPEEMIRHVPVEGARKMIADWHDKGYRICIMTGRPLDTKDVSIEWLDLHGFIYDSFSIVNKYGRNSSEGGISISLETLSTKRFNLAIEDSGQMAQFLSERMETRVALLNRPWNHHLSFNHNVVRCDGWADIGRFFGTL